MGKIIMKKDMTRVRFELTPRNRDTETGSGEPEPCALDQLGHLAVDVQIYHFLTI